MKTKTLAASLLLTATLTLSGCLATDSLINARSRNPLTGAELYIDNITHEKTESPVDALGNANEPSFDPIPSQGLMTIGSLFGLIPGGWGTVAVASLPALAALYWKFRRKKTASDAAKAALKVVLAKFAEVKLDWEKDVLDKDGDGKISLEEAADYIKMKGMAWLRPASLQEMLDIFASELMSEEQKQNALEALASRL